MGMAGEIWGDARAALGIINRNGLGKTRHIDTGLLWIQQTVAQQRLKFDKVLGKENPADMYTKYLDWASLEKHTQRFHCEFASGRAAEAPQLHRISQSLDEYWMMGESRQWPILEQILGALTDKHKKRQRTVERGNLSTRMRAKGKIHCKQTNGRRCDCVNWPHGVTTLTACEQQMKPPIHNQQLPQQERKGAETITTTGSYGERQGLKQKALKQVSPARSLSEELYSNIRRGTW